MRPRLGCVCLLLATIGFAGTAEGAVGLNVDFGTYYGTPAVGYGGAAGQAGAWNLAGLGVTALDDLTGSPSGVSLDLVADAAGGNNGISPSNDDELLLNDNFYSFGGGSWSIAVSGLADGDYRVVLYAPANGAVSSGDMTVGGVPMASIPGNIGTLVEGTSWVSVDVTVTGGLLAITGASASYSGLAGLQLVRLVPASLNVDFGTSYGTPAVGYGGAAGQAGAWNLAGLGVTALDDLTGSPSGVSLDVVADSAGGSTGISPSNDDELLLNDNFYSSGGGSWSIAVSGLADGDYRVVLYAPANGVVSSGDMTVGGVPVASIPGNIGTLVEGTSWVSVDVAVTGGLLAITGAGAGYSGLAGLQLVRLVPASLSVDFGTYYGTPAVGYGGAAGQAGAWNLAGLGVTALDDLTGSPSGVSLDLVADAAGGNNGISPSNDDELLLNDNFYSSGGGSWSIAVSGLADGDYRVVLYAPANGAVSSGDMTVGGVPVASIPGNIGTLVEGTSWVSVDVTVTGGLLAITGASASYSGLAGLQLVRLVPASLNVDFGTSYGTPAVGYGGATGQAGAWNLAGLGVTALDDLTGSPSGVSLDVVADTAGGSTGISPSNDDELLLNDNFYSSGGGSWSIAVSGLADGDYRVVLYAPANGVVSSGDMTVGGVPVASIPGNIGTLVEGTSWVSVDVAVTGGPLAITGASAGYSGLAGLQVGYLPEPDGLPLLLAGLLCAITLARSPRARSRG